MQFFRFKRFALFLILSPLLLITRAWAGPPSEYDDGIQVFRQFFPEVSGVVNNIINDPVLSQVANMTFLFFCGLMIIALVFRYNSKTGIEFHEILSAVILIALVRLMMSNYDSLTSMWWGWSEGWAERVQVAALGPGASDAFFVSGFISDAIKAITWEDYSIFDGVIAVISVGVLYIASFLMSVLSLFAVAWALWGYAVAKITGFMFIPFLLSRQLNWLFDGWFRFFLGFLIYNVVARVNLVLLAVMFRAYLGLPPNTYSVPANTAYYFDVANLTDAVGLLIILAIGIFSLILTGKMAQAIVGGVGGFSGAVTALALGATKGKAIAG